MIWKEIDNFPDYQVSDTGEVRSTKYWGQFKRKNSEGLLQQRTYKSGYKYVNLYKEGHMYSVKIHRLVAHAFLPNPNNLPQVNHKDENKSNNDVTNLEWCTAKHNLSYNDLQKRSHQKQKRRIKAYNSSSNLEFGSATDAAIHITKCGLSKSFNSAISNIVASANKGNRLNYGYYWEWLEESKRKSR